MAQHSTLATIAVRFVAGYFLLVIVAPAVHAQNELLRERFSLQGLQEIGFTVNTQGQSSIVEDPDISLSAIRQNTIQKLAASNIRHISEFQVRSSADIPFLYMHINTMQLENELVFFSISLRLYQPVRLILNRDLETSASTWESETIGVVSRSQLGVITDAADKLVEGFLIEFRNANL